MHEYYCTVRWAKARGWANRVHCSVVDQLVHQLCAPNPASIIVVGGGYLGSRATKGCKATPVLQSLLRALAAKRRVVVVDEVLALLFGRVGCWALGVGRYTLPPPLGPLQQPLVVSLPPPSSTPHHAHMPWLAQHTRSSAMLASCARTTLRPTPACSHHHTLHSCLALAVPYVQDLCQAQEANGAVLPTWLYLQRVRQRDEQVGLSLSHVVRGVQPLCARVQEGHEGVPRRLLCAAVDAGTLECLPGPTSGVCFFLPPPFPCSIPHRDENAARNFLEVFWAHVRGECRPEHLQRRYNQGAPASQDGPAVGAAAAPA